MDFSKYYMEKERDYLSKFAVLSENSKGRKIQEKDCEIRTCFQRDRDRILHSKSFRRLKHKTQVFISPNGDHFRTRLTHTLEVAQIGRTIARAIRLNEDLVEAISLGHDLGHTPFGHIGEAVLDKINPNGFRHYDQSIRVVDFLENSNPKRRGLNLTFEVLDGIKNHAGSNLANTMEGRLVKYSDRIAYINHDIDDAIRAGILKKEDLPNEIINILGDSHGKRIDTMVKDVIENSFDREEISMSLAVQKATDALRKFMFENVYLNKVVRKEAEKAEYVINEVYNFFKSDLKRLPQDHLKLYEDEKNKDEIVTDYIAGMTDKYLLFIFNDIFIPKSWTIG